MRFPAALRALEHRDFRLFWSGQLVSLVGRWMQSVGLGWLVLELTGSPLRLGVVSALQFLPILFLAVVAGAVADRVPKRRLILATQTGLMLPAFALAALVWGGGIEYWHLVVFAAVLGVFNALDMPARQSFVIELVGRDDLVNAIALNSAVFNTARMVGPALAGPLIAYHGTAAAFLANGVSSLAVLGALAVMRTDGQPKRAAAATTSIGAEIADGLRYAAGTPVIGLILSLVVAVSVFALNHSVILPLLARDVLESGVGGFGLLMGAVGAGAVAGAIGLASLTRGQLRVRTVLGAGVTLCLGLLGLAIVRHLWLALGLAFVMGLGQLLFLAGANTTLQVTAPDELRGRVMSLYTVAFTGVSPVGAFLTGAVAETFGVSVACAVGGGLGLTVILALAAYHRVARA